METVYMVIYDDSKGNNRWLCSGRNNTPFTTFYDYKARAEVTKLNKIGYKAVIVPVNPSKYIKQLNK